MELVCQSMEANNSEMHLEVSLKELAEQLPPLGWLAVVRPNYLRSTDGSSPRSA